jgi:antitoxin VapB
MLTKIFKSGDSLAVHIPKEMLFEEDQDVDIAREGDALVIRPIRRDSLAGVAGAFASFPAGLIAEGRDFNEQ